MSSNAVPEQVSPAKIFFGQKIKTKNEDACFPKLPQLKELSIKHSTMKNQFNRHHDTKN